MRWEKYQLLSNARLHVRDGQVGMVARAMTPLPSLPSSTTHSTWQHIHQVISHHMEVVQQFGVNVLELALTIVVPKIPANSSMFRSHPLISDFALWVLYVLAVTIACAFSRGFGVHPCIGRFRCSRHEPPHHDHQRQGSCRAT